MGWLPIIREAANRDEGRRISTFSKNSEENRLSAESRAGNKERTHFKPQPTSKIPTSIVSPICIRHMKNRAKCDQTHAKVNLYKSFETNR